MTVVETVLVGLVLNVVSFEVGNRLAGKNKVSNDSCKERREACNALVCQKIDSLKQHITDSLSKN